MYVVSAFRRRYSAFQMYVVSAFRRTSAISARSPAKAGHYIWVTKAGSYVYVTPRFVTQYT